MQKPLNLLIIVVMLVQNAYAEFRMEQMFSGVYGDSLLIGINKDEKYITGYYDHRSNEIGQHGVKWSCLFYFSGLIERNGKTKIIATSVDPCGQPSVITKGEIYPAQDWKNSITLKLYESLPGCSRGDTFTSQMPVPIQLTEKQQWIELRMVNVDRSYFHASKNSSPRKAYVVCGDIVTVMAKDKKVGKVKVEFVSGKKITEGWLLESDLLPIGMGLTCK